MSVPPVASVAESATLVTASAIGSGSFSAVSLTLSATVATFSRTCGLRASRSAWARSLSACTFSSA